jgi:hypothetical protein
MECLEKRKEEQMRTVSGKSGAAVFAENEDGFPYWYGFSTGLGAFGCRQPISREKQES